MGRRAGFMPSAYIFVFPVYWSYHDRWQAACGALYNRHFLGQDLLNGIQY